LNEFDYKGNLRIVEKIYICATNNNPIGEDFKGSDVELTDGRGLLFRVPPQDWENNLTNVEPSAASQKVFDLEAEIQDFKAPYPSPSVTNGATIEIPFRSSIVQSTLPNNNITTNANANDNAIGTITRVGDPTNIGTTANNNNATADGIMFACDTTPTNINGTINTDSTILSVGDVALTNNNDAAATDSAMFVRDTAPTDNNGATTTDGTLLSVVTPTHNNDAATTDGNMFVDETKPTNNNDTTTDTIAPNSTRTRRKQPLSSSSSSSSTKRKFSSSSSLDEEE
jgi:hypothetical protein